MSHCYWPICDEVFIQSRLQGKIHRKCGTSKNVYNIQLHYIYQCLHVFFSDVEIKDICIFNYSLFLAGFWYAHEPLLQAPSYHYLSWSLVIPGELPYLDCHV